MKQLTQDQDLLRQKIAANVAVTMSMGIIERLNPADVPIRVKGEIDRVGKVISRGYLSAVKVESVAEINRQQSGRLELSQWLSSPNNPLTARVYVNRIWSKLLGAGIVATVDNFGVQGDAPTHPELLDYLATQFVKNNWSTKRLVRGIVLSHAYTVEELADAKAAEVDFSNKLLWRWNRKRLEGEVIRDTALALGGDGPQSPGRRRRGLRGIESLWRLRSAASGILPTGRSSGRQGVGYLARGRPLFRVAFPGCAVRSRLYQRWNYLLID